VAPNESRTAISSERARAAGQQQVRYVGAGDEQDDARRRQQQRERRFHLPVHRTLSATSIRERQHFGAKPLHGGVAHLRVQRRLDVVDDRMVDRVREHLCPLHRYARRKTREYVHPVREPIRRQVRETRNHAPCDYRLHGDRNVYHGLDAERGPLESLRRHADDGHRLPVDHDLLPDDVRIGAKVILPIAVAQHRDELLSGHAIVVEPDQPAERRAHA